MAVPFHPRRLCLVDDQDRSARGRRRLALSLVRCAQPGRGKPLVYVRSELSLAGSEDKVLALDARRCPSGLLAQTNSRLSQSIFESFSLLNTTTLLHALLLRGLAGARPATSSRKTATVPCGDGCRFDYDLETQSLVGTDQVVGAPDYVPACARSAPRHIRWRQLVLTRDAHVETTCRWSIR